MLLDMMLYRAASAPLSLTGIVLAVTLCISTVFDLVFRRIPNLLLFFSLLALIVIASLSGFYELLRLLVGALFGIVLILPAYLCRSMGAGDVKLVGVVGAAVGALHVPSILLSTILIGGLISSVFLLSKNQKLKESGIPYAVAITGGVLQHFIFLS
ncbi:MAG: prepilin peptidase [Burkholderiales bacterium]|jgi:prepilin peptidase CpaA